MTKILMHSASDSAKNDVPSAKPSLLHDKHTGFAEFEGLTLTLDGIRVYLHSNAAIPWLYLVRVRGAYALYLQARAGPRVWLIAERSKRVRLFKRLETALSLCRQLEVSSVVVKLQELNELQQDVVVLQT